MLMCFYVMVSELIYSEPVYMYTAILIVKCAVSYDIM